MFSFKKLIQLLAVATLINACQKGKVQEPTTQPKVQPTQPAQPLTGNAQATENQVQVDSIACKKESTAEKCKKDPNKDNEVGSSKSTETSDIQVDQAALEKLNELIKLANLNLSQKVSGEEFPRWEALKKYLDEKGASKDSKMGTMKSVQIESTDDIKVDRSIQLMTIVLMPNSTNKLEQHRIEAKIQICKAIKEEKIDCDEFSFLITLEGVIAKADRSKVTYDAKMRLLTRATEKATDEEVNQKFAEIKNSFYKESDTAEK